jgi:uncharacterized protein YjhX (UPF0386 family)
MGIIIQHQSNGIAVIGWAKTNGWIYIVTLLQIYQKKKSDKKMRARKNYSYSISA